jgi:hypothetical protein
MVQRVGSDSFRRNREDELREMLGLAGHEGEEDSAGSDAETEAQRPANSISESAIWQAKLTDQLNAKNEAVREVARLKKEMQLMQEKQKEELSNIRQMSRSQLQIMRAHIQKKDERIQALKAEYAQARARTRSLARTHTHTQVQRHERRNRQRVDDEDAACSQYSAHGTARRWCGR